MVSLLMDVPERTTRGLLAALWQGEISEAEARVVAASFCPEARWPVELREAIGERPLLPLRRKVSWSESEWHTCARWALSCIEGRETALDLVIAAEMALDIGTMSMHVAAFQAYCDAHELAQERTWAECMLAFAQQQGYVLPWEFVSSVPPEWALAQDGAGMWVNLTWGAREELMNVLGFFGDTRRVPEREGARSSGASA